jgi:hypothetical protein
MSTQEPLGEMEKTPLANHVAIQICFPSRVSQKCFVATALLALRN